MPQRKKPPEEQPDTIRAALLQDLGHAREGEKASLLREAIRLCTNPN